MIRIKGTILCAGNLVLDILVRPVDEPRYGATTWVETIEQHLGGNCSNASYALALLGAPVRALGAVGADEAGGRVLSWLAAAGVDLSAVHRSATSPTATSVVLVAAGGERCLLHQPGASDHAFSQPVEFTAALLEGAGHFHLANPFALAGMRRGAAETLRRAKSAGLTTSMDAGWDPMGEWLEVLGPCLEHTGLLFVNQDEARMLSGSPDPVEAGHRLRDRGVADVVVKLGAHGSAVFTAEGEIRSASFPVEAVDTTGAGDCYAAGFLAALRRGAGPAEAARFANAVGALSVRKLGSVEGLLGYEETLAWIAGHNPAADS
ncbi:MAG: carbohydrate kinase family protein [Bryobacteraceae bacterium]